MCFCELQCILWAIVSTVSISVYVGTIICNTPSPYKCMCWLWHGLFPCGKPLDGCDNVVFPSLMGWRTSWPRPLREQREIWTMVAMLFCVESKYHHNSLDQCILQTLNLLTALLRVCVCTCVCVCVCACACVRVCVCVCVCVNEYHEANIGIGVKH